MSFTEKLCTKHVSDIRGTMRRDAKRATRRWRRRVEKRHGEDAPKRNAYRGWTN